MQVSQSRYSLTEALAVRIQQWSSLPSLYRSSRYESTPDITKDGAPVPLKGRRGFTLAWKLFRFATCTDVLMMLIGTLAAVISGTAQSLQTLLFGRILNELVYHSISIELAPTNQTLQGGSCEEASNSILLSFATNSSYFCGNDDDQIQNILDYVCDPDELLVDRITLFSIFFIVLGTVVFFAAYLATFLWNVSGYRQTIRMRKAFYQSVLREEMGWFDVKEASKVNTLLTDDIEKIQAAIGDKAAIFIGNMSTFISAFVVAFAVSWKMALVDSAVLPLLVILAAVTTKIIASFTVRERKGYASAGAIAEEVLSSIRTVVAFGGEEKEAERYCGHLKVAKHEGIKKGCFTSAAVSFLYFVVFALFALGFWYGSTLILDCEVVVGDVITVLFTVMVGSLFLGNALPELQTFATAVGSAAGVFDVMDHVPVIDISSEEGEVLERIHGDIQFCDVSFQYPARPDVQVLRGFNMTVKNGQTVALVGSTGCGKSTVVQLLQRFYDPSSGQVLLDGRDVRALNLRWLRSNIGVVSQEPVLFNVTIAENIRLGKEDATTAEIEGAARKANAHDFITQLPSGYDTYVGEQGTKLSGGQKQRIAIARALVRDPKILLLDEATSALDTESEGLVQEALERASEGRTTIVIAHRLTTIRNAALINVIGEGNVVESGSHKELMAQEGAYHELVKAQTLEEQEKEMTPDDEPPSELRPSSAGGLGDSHSTVHSGFSHSHSSELAQTSKPKKTLFWRKASKGGESVTTFDLLKLNLPDWHLVLIGSIAFSVVGSLFPVVAIIYSEALEVFGETDKDTIETETTRIAFGFLGLATAVGLIYFIGSSALFLAGERLTKRMRYQSFQAMLSQDMAWFDDPSNTTGALATKLATDTSRMKAATGIRFGNVFQNLCAFVTGVIIAFEASWELTILVLGIFPVVIVIYIIQNKELAGRVHTNRKKLQDSGETVVESIQNIRTVASLGVERYFLRKYSEQLKEPFRGNIRGVFVQAMTNAAAQAILFYIYGAAFWFVGFLVVNERTDYDSVYRVFTALATAAAFSGHSTGFAADAKKAEASAVKIVKLLRTRPTIDSRSLEGIKMKSTSGSIDFTGVQFSYPTRPQVMVLKGLDLRVASGQTFALAGHSGGGKSTVVALVERFYDPQGGSVTLDGCDLRDLNVRWLRSQIGMVSQEPVLFDRSIADNIRYGDNSREVPEAEVIEAAKAANIHHFITSLPQGYSTNVGAKGTQLSGGQKQRIAIARALVRDPKILLLDEATSALDTESERIVQEALEKASEGRTTIVIAHRLSTISTADTIAVIDGGEVVEAGSHRQLMALKGSYYNFHNTTTGNGSC